MAIGENVKETFKILLSDPVGACGAIFLFSALALCTAFISEYVIGLEPCVLCIYQRWSYAVAGLVSIAGLVTLYDEAWSRFTPGVVFTCAVVFFVGAAIAAYHVGVEQHWWKSALEGCAVDFESGSVEELMAILDNKPAARCDEVAWKDPFLGISMAGYNFLLSFALGVIFTFSSALIARRQNGVL